MSGTPTAVAILAGTLLAGGVLVHAGQSSSPARPSIPPPVVQTQGQTPGGVLPLTPTIRERGTSITPAFEGWFQGKDGFDYALVGYFNRNTKEEFDIPVGPDNHIDPGGPDFGQPTHFLLGRQWGMFAIKLPKDFGNKKLVWTLVTNGFTNQITLHTAPVYIVEPYGSSWNENRPPIMKLTENGEIFTGPPVKSMAAYTTTVGEPLALTAWISDDGVGRTPEANTGAAAPGRGATAARGGGAAGTARGTAANQPPGAPAGRGRAGAGAAAAGAGGGGLAARQPVSITWEEFRGSGVSFAHPKPSVEFPDGHFEPGQFAKTETTATFSSPGNYIIRVLGNDSSGDGGAGEQCCWTSAHIDVTVKPKQ